MSNEKLKFEWIDNPDRIGERLFTFDGKKYITCSVIIHMRYHQ